MLKQIFSYEFKLLMKSLSTYIYTACFAGLAMLMLLGTAGFFDGPAASGEVSRFLNSPYEINFILKYFNKFFLFLLPAIVGTTLYKDFKSGTHQLLYSFPLKKSSYLFGKFFSAICTVLLITLTVPLALIGAELILTTANPNIGPMTLSAYARSYTAFVLPNMLFYGAIVFALTSKFRSVYAGFIFVLVLFLLQIIVQNLFASDLWLLALLDPFADYAVDYETALWTVNQKNQLHIPLTGAVLRNRLFWGSTCLAVFLVFYKRFTFRQESLSGVGLFSRKNKISQTSEATGISYQNSDVKLQFDFWHQLKTTFALAQNDFKYIVSNKMFLFFLAFGILAIIFALGKVTNTGSLILMPATRIVLTVPLLFFKAIIAVITFLFTGMLMHRARTVSMHQLIGATAAKNWTLIASKLMAMVQVQALLLLIMMICGICLQVYNGYYHFEFGLYIYHLFCLVLPSLFVWALLSVFIHTFAPNPYVGIFVLLLIWVGKDMLPEAGINTQLLAFNAAPMMKYSDLNGYGSALAGHLLMLAYWLSVTAGLGLIAYLFMKRQETNTFKERFQIAKTRISKSTILAFALGTTMVAVLGLKIAKEEALAAVRTESKMVLTQFQEQFGHYEGFNLPKIIDVKLELDLFPEQQSFSAKGSYTLVNKSQAAIDTLLVKTGYDEMTDYTINIPTQLIEQHEQMQFQVLHLEQSLLPGDSLKMEFEIASRPNTLFERNNAVLSNGTFLQEDILPRFGYFMEEEHMHPSSACAKHHKYSSPDADLVNIETIISTSKGQTAIATGVRMEDWITEDRHYFRYKSDQPLKFAFAFNSGSFDTHVEQYNGRTLEVFYHPTHTYNLTKMIAGLKAAIDYNEQHFTEYQHQETRIIEFPISEGTLATLMANSIPTSEARFLINQKDDDEKIDLSFYVPAHELTHQWFGNQLAPSAALGAKVLTESITEYITLQIYRNHYGTAKALSFLNQQHLRYLKGRTRTKSPEVPLYLAASEDQYLAYGKGTIALNAIKHYIGEEKLNAAIKELLVQYQFRTDQYPGSLDLISILEKHMPQKYQYLLEDYFKAITFYDAKIDNASLRESENTYQLELDLHLQKYREQEIQEQLELNDFIQIACYDEKGNMLAVHTLEISENLSSLKFNTEVKPAKIVLDPNRLIIDKDQKDNTIIL